MKIIRWLFQSNRRALLALAAVATVFVSLGEWKHQYDRPWAYGDAPLLVGTWKGKFIDPDGVPKDLEMIIAVPERKYLRKTRRRVRRYRDASEFKGFATVTSRLGVERHRIDGDVANREGHELENISFAPLDEKKQVLKWFNVFAAQKGGKWDGDQMQLVLGFTYRTETGSAYWSSADPRFDTKAHVTLTRAPNP